MNDGASAVLLYGRPLPPGSLGDPGVPVVGVPESLARAALAEIRQRFPIEAALAGATSEPNRAAGGVASFSSRGLSFGGLLEPQLSAPGIGIATSDPGSAGDGEPAFVSVTGTSVSAASVAGAAALVAQGRPGLSAEDLASLLAGSARPTAPRRPQRASGRSMSARAPSASWPPRRPRSASAPGRAHTGVRAAGSSSQTSPAGA